MMKIALMLWMNIVLIMIDIALVLIDITLIIMMKNSIDVYDEK